MNGSRWRGLIKKQASIISELICKIIQVLKPPRIMHRIIMNSTSPLPSVLVRSERKIRTREIPSVHNKWLRIFGAVISNKGKRPIYATE